MVKRKREEPSLEENVQKWEKELARCLKTAKGFERQRMSKRIRESQADPEKVQRLEREVAVLKNLDLHQAAHQHLCSSVLKIKGVAEAPKLPATIKPVPKPTLSEEERVALHNVTSALCNRKQVKDIIEEAIMGTCIALRVPMPEKKGKGKGKKNERKEQEEQADDIKKEASKGAEKTKDSAKMEKAQAMEKKAKSSEKHTGPDEEDSWEGVSPAAGEPEDGDEDENIFSRFKDMLAGSSEDESEGGAASDEDDLQDSRARSIRGPSDYFSGSSADEDSGSEAGAEDEDENELGSDEEETGGDDDDDEAEEEQEESEEEASSDSEAVSPPPPPPKRARAAAKAVTTGNSTFLPTLMGGYISGSESEASDLEDLAPKKNRRGQRARQAIWEKKFKSQAKHLVNQQNSRDAGWDTKRGAVGEGDAGPWKKGVKNPFDKRAPAQEGVHPQRQNNFARAEQAAYRPAQGRPPPPPPPAKRERDDTGSLHPSWAAAKLAKESSQKVAFQGTKVVFD